MSWTVVSVRYQHQYQSNLIDPLYTRGWSQQGRPSGVDIVCHEPLKLTMKIKRSRNPLPRLPQGFIGKITTVNIVYMLLHFAYTTSDGVQECCWGAWRGDWLIIVLLPSLPLFCPLLLFKIQLPNGPSSFAGRDLHLGQLNKKGKEFEDMQVQNLLSGAIVVGDLSLAKSLLRDMSLKFSRCQQRRPLPRQTAEYCCWMGSY